MLTDHLQGYDYSEQKIITNKKLVIDLNSNSVGTISTTGSGSVTVENSSNKEVSVSADNGSTVVRGEGTFDSSTDAVPEVKKFTVTFNPNGGTFADGTTTNKRLK